MGCSASIACYPAKIPHFFERPPGRGPTLLSQLDYSTRPRDALQRESPAFECGSGRRARWAHRDRDMINSHELFFLSCSTVTATPTRLLGFCGMKVASGGGYATCFESRGE